MIHRTVGVTRGRVMRCSQTRIKSRLPLGVNVDKLMRFTLGDQVIERKLVLEARDLLTQISTASPVGRLLTNAQVGQEFSVPAPDGDLVVKVLEVR